MPECSFKIGDRQSKKKQWNCNGRVIRNATRGIDAGRRVSRHRSVSDGSDGARPLWRSHSARTELFFADVNIQKVGNADWIQQQPIAKFSTECAIVV